MNVAITGASGMIGKRLRKRLVEAGHTALPIPRAADDSALAEILAPADVVVNLAGEPVAQRWTEAARKRIHDSRVEGTRRLGNALATPSASTSTRSHTAAAKSRSCSAMITVRSNDRTRSSSSS